MFLKSPFYNVLYYQRTWTKDRTWRGSLITRLVRKSVRDEISLETDDPVTRPLPDFRLLEMQWFLHRVAAMSGAAEPQDNFRGGGDDSDEWDTDIKGEPDMDVEEMLI